MKKHLTTIVLTSVLAFCAATATAAVTYEYDGLHRLTKVTYDDGTAIHYDYDAVGNRTVRVGNDDPSTVYLATSTVPPATGWVVRDPELTWYPLNSFVDVTALAQGICEFLQWTGDVPPGKEYDNPLALIPGDYLYPYTSLTAQFDSPYGHMDEDCNANAIPDGCEWEDCNGNDALDACDLLDGTSDDCNANAIPDECDIADGTSQDCNVNAIPDECDIADGTSQDCNANAIPDDCDIADGTSQDCNANAIPDECDIADGTSEDCNANAVPDECDIADGTSQDCNANAIPDECDIADGTSEDCNANAIPDECEWADCNENDVLDECDILDGTSEDCNGNTIPDECDIADGTSEDNNGNGIPDECEPPCPCDCEDPPDGTVDVGDFLHLLSQWGGPGPCDCEDPPDGAVDVGDFLAILANWGACPSGEVSDCCFMHDTPGCDDPECEAIVCDRDPWCCEETWDQFCANEAQGLCGDLCGSRSGPLPPPRGR